MDTEIAYHNTDFTLRAMAEQFKNKNLKIFGLKTGSFSNAKMLYRKKYHTYILSEAADHQGRVLSAHPRLIKKYQFPMYPRI